jgi:hypothetical protein
MLASSRLVHRLHIARRAPTHPLQQLGIESATPTNLRGTKPRRAEIFYFPIDCLISLLTAVDKRRTLEVGMAGGEVMAGMPFILGPNSPAKWGDNFPGR